MRAPRTPEVGTATMIHHWRRVAFVHWRYPAELVQALVPGGLEVETCDGSAWVSLVPFLMHRVRPPRMPPLPWLSTFPETNLRTYVRGPEGGSGIFFFTLDATRLAAVLAARASLALPYRWSAAALRRRDGCLEYVGVRRWPGPVPAGYALRVRVGTGFAQDEPDELDHFLTARHRLYTALAGRLVAVDAEHPPWPLHRAAVERLREDLTVAAGLPSPDQAPLAHASPGVRVRIGLPRVVGRAR
jgi:uncharacterized protein YqjF (DUF2071 family)